MKFTILFLGLISITTMGICQDSVNNLLTYENHIKSNLPSHDEIDVFLNELSWAQFDPDIGYILGNYIPKDGMDGSSTISTVQENGARTSFMYPNKKSRINTYGNSFTQCHQVSDGETWQEYLAAHLGEPIRNFGMGGLGVYQAYKRMLREEKTEHRAEYDLLYIWGDDHVRSLLRCRYMLTTDWNKTQNDQEGIGTMFHGNFWSNIEMDLETGKMVEKNSLISSPDSLYKMTDPEWMYDHLKDDLALQMALFIRGKIKDPDIPQLEVLASHLGINLDLSDPVTQRVSIGNLLNKYAFKATKYILEKSAAFAEANNKKLMIILFDPYGVTNELIMSGTRYDQEILDYLNKNSFNYFDMNLVHVDDFNNYNLTLTEYYKKYFIGHYNPTGNHFFAFSLKPKIVEWLDPKPITYQETKKKQINFKGYLQGF